MKILFILDPFTKLQLDNDTSLELIRNSTYKGHACYMGLASDLFAINGKVSVTSQRITPKKNSFKFMTDKPKKFKTSYFDIILVRKEPPFDMPYIYMTYLLDLASKSSAILNNPMGIRNTNEKFASVHFPTMIPKTLISSSHQEILSFQKKYSGDLILKPLNDCGGRGISLLKKDLPLSKKNKLIFDLTEKTTTPIISQHFIANKRITSDKRVFLLDGKFLAVYERVFAQGDFRGNLHAGASYKATELTPTEKKCIRKIGPWVKKRGLHFVGLDFLANKLLEINVTCPGGLVEADRLYPALQVFEKLRESIEQHARKAKV